MIGGENVYPAEVENAIMGCPGVAEAAVIGVPDERWGETVKAIVLRAPGSDLDEAAVIDWVRARIAGYKTPKSVVFSKPCRGTGPARCLGGCCASRIGTGADDWSDSKRERVHGGKDRD